MVVSKFRKKKEKKETEPQVLLAFLHFSDPPENTNLTTTANISATPRNSNVTFTCSSEGNPPPREYRFYHEGTFLGNSSSGSFHTHVTESGIYFCVPVNKAGEGEKRSVAITVVGECNVSCSSYLREIRNSLHQMCRPGLTL